MNQDFFFKIVFAWGLFDKMLRDYVSLKRLNVKCKLKLASTRRAFIDALLPSSAFMSVPF